LPKPVQRPHPPIIVGGRGPKRTPELAARYADEFNMPFKSVADTAQAFERVKDACDLYARPPGRELTLSAGVVVAVGRTDAEAARRAAPLHVPSALPPEDPVYGSPDALVQRIGELREVGATRVHLRVIDMADLDLLDLIASDVLPQVNAS
jgi:alkanesulfonate monooxygenase SsuD/methylene tetrahydromethanopterin reductase-like flavin-dependent oxidoreductase (luciferase family)